MEQKVIPLKLSHSNLETLNTCERKFQLDHLLEGSAVREESEHLSFGTAYGIGIASYLVHQDQDRAIWEAYMGYWPLIESDRKNEELMIAGLLNSFSKLDDLLQDYEVVEVDGKPATELTFRILIDDEYFFKGAIDVVLKNRWTGMYYVMDVKTTGLQLFDLSPLYENSGQTLGYSIGIDALVGEKQAAYGVLYFVLQLGKTKGESKVHILAFEKTILDRLNWFLTLGMDVNRLKQMEEMGVYPKRGSSCLQFMRPCKYFGTCGLHSADVRKTRTDDLGYDGKPEVYHLTFKMDDLITDHIKRVTNLETIL